MRSNVYSLQQDSEGASHVHKSLIQKIDDEQLEGSGF